MRMDGMGTPTIAKVLNERGIRTPLGTHPWTPTHVWRLLKTKGATELMDELSGVD